MDSKLTGWKSAAGWTAALLMATLWLVAGLWKLSDISSFQVKLNQLLVPAALTLPATLAVASGELFAGLLLLRPAWRRLGGLFSTVLLLVFMAYVGINYEPLRGADCSCFPWVERAVGPLFFWGDGAMVAVSLIAAVFAPKMARLGQLKGLMVGVLVLAGAALGWDKLGPQPGGDVPATIQVEGQEYQLDQGKKFIYFFNPTCLHCLDVGMALSKYEFQADFLGVPTQDPDFAQGFLEDAGLVGKVKISPDLELLKKTFAFEDVPYAAAVEDGKILHRFPMIELEEPEMGAKLKELGIVK
ncbi:MAG: hypothetical protein GC160_27975 [Acidobacteria bacterium]|nr:hypothetical protein [Acidobacteriota bacterium]